MCLRNASSLHISANPLEAILLEVDGGVSARTQNGPSPVYQIAVRVRLEVRQIDSKATYDARGARRVLDPRWTSENRPYVDTSKPANAAEPGQEYLYRGGASSGKHFFMR